MKKVFVVLATLSLTATVHAKDFEYKGYMRAPVGTNSFGGKQITLNNPGSKGNEFRLGNETGYGEAGFIKHFNDVDEKTNPYFNAYLTFAYNPSMNSQYADTAPSGDRIQFIEAYAKGGNFDAVPVSFWAGKRFYRDADIHMDDFFYFADMSGNGGGLEDWQLSVGKLSVALLQFVDDRSLTNTTNGSPAKQALDIRLKEFKINDANQLMFWLAYGYTGPGKGTLAGTTTIQDYQASSGTVAGVRWTRLLNQAENNFAVSYGTGVMESLSLDNTAYAVDDTVKKRTRLRFVENYVAELNEKWAIQGAAVYEQANNGLDTRNKSSWTSLGVRPMYYFTDHFRIQAELGYSVVKDEAESSSTSTDVGDRKLTRITIAPEIALKKGYFARPVLRFFATHSIWNDANKDVSNTSSLVGKLKSSGITALNDKGNETAMGFEAEVWF